MAHKDGEKPDDKNVKLGFKRALRSALSQEHPELYDQHGQLIPQGSDLWNSAKDEFRGKISGLLERILDKIPFEIISTSEEGLREALSRGLRDEAKPAFVFTPHDGKLTIPLKIKAGKVEIQGTIPIYKIIGAMAIGGTIVD